MQLLLGLPAPAKLNLFLHITGRRADGYHLLQSVFVPVALSDTLDVELRRDGRITRSGDVIGAPEQDLVVRAARLLQQASGTTFGAALHLTKRIPAGSGLGGGSSDAATTLTALNRLWQLHWPRAQLAALALQLGADVPFFLGPGPALVEGIGEHVTGVSHELADRPLWAVIVHPQVHVSTAEIFAAPGLTRSTKPVTIRALSEVLKPSAPEQHGVDDVLFGRNDLQPEVVRRTPAVNDALNALASHTSRTPRMSGSGSAVFVLTDAESDAQRMVAAMQVRPEFSSWAVRCLAEHPLSAWLSETHSA